jgi:hypothetical protein
MPSPEVSETMRLDALEALTDHYLADAARLGFSSGEILSTIQKHSIRK